MDKALFMSGYCLEYAIALKEHYQKENIEVMLCGLLKYCNEPGVEDHDVLHEKAPGIYEVIDYIDQVEVSHFFILKKSKNGNFIFEDVEGNKSFDSIAKNSLFISHNLNDKIKIIAFDSDEDAESYNAEIDRGVVDEALKIIKKIKKHVKS